MPSLLQVQGAVLPRNQASEAYSEDELAAVEELSFLTSFVNEALQNGSAPYIPPEERTSATLGGVPEPAASSKGDVSPAWCFSCRFAATLCMLIGGCSQYKQVHLLEASPDHRSNRLWHFKGNSREGRCTQLMLYNCFPFSPSSHQELSIRQAHVSCMRPREATKA
eukprot:1141296-Pelagomonas_calceolata.AAC.10